MKILCDVCHQHHASLFCTADEAALCDACDHRVHHANKLASKHQRFSLTHPSAKHFPLCDVCQEKRAFVFCHQDRAILCKDCDVSIHSANELTKDHTRFLLTGIKFSASASPFSSSSSSSSPSPSPKKNPVLDSSHPPSNSPSTPSPPKPGGNLPTHHEPAFTGSSISEYLINTIPGMKFEDFLDSHSVPFACSKNGDEMLPLFGGGNMVSFSPGGIWVPQAPSSSAAYWEQMNEQNGYREGREGSNRSSFGDDNFIVPQMSPPSNVSKRSRLLW